MPTKTKFKEINKCELNALLERVAHAIEHHLALDIDDLKLLMSAITTLCELQDRMAQDDVTLHKLKKLLGMIKQSESRKKPGQSKSNTSKKSTKKNNRITRKGKPPVVVYYKITEHKKGDICPCCGKGKLYNHSAGGLLRITGHAPFDATRHVTEQYRCNGCLQIYKAQLPADVLADGHDNQKYGFTARTLMVLNKFYTGTPYYHQSNLSEILGINIKASTIFDQCQHVADAVEPVLIEMKKLAADAKNFDLDDTHHRILDQKPELREKRNGKGKQLRSGIYTSGLIATLDDDTEIILYETSLGHAGEHLDSILKYRNSELEPPVTMSDALSSNTSLYPVNSAYCNAHCRRQFYDIEEQFPKDVTWILDTYAIIWANEKEVNDQKLNAKQRLEYHKVHSLPAMEALRTWAKNRYDSSDFEEHSIMGKAIKYLLRHYDKLVKFCYVEGAKIDNNRMEERLKIVIRGRKTSHFYKTAIGAEVANKLISLIVTADVAGINIYDYICDLQRHRVEVKQNPAAWLPWHYEQTIAELNNKLKPDKAA
ncbi:IS66 family transposase [Shewanella sp.]|uniref:IS66 family transposase n=1 Tax=Shewanella sp. TaxID=50422 RepID=UPI0025856166|nr:IS66 family transposase [Shewanella sp.]MCJ8305280.1 IS66 family transposase [Shewanella sp.]